MVRWEMRIEEPDQSARNIDVTPGLTIGRHPDNKVVLSDPKTSGHHATVRVDATGRLVFADLGSLNKSRVEGGPILGKEESVPLRDGLRIFLGRTVLTVTDRDRIEAGPSGTILLEDDDLDPKFAEAATVRGDPVAIAEAIAAQKAAADRAAAEKAAAIKAAAEKAAAEKAAAEKAAAEKAAAEKAAAEKAAAEKAAAEKAAAEKAAAEKAAAEKAVPSDSAAAKAVIEHEPGEASAPLPAGAERVAADGAALEKAAAEKAAAEKAAAEKAAAEKAAAEKAAAEKAAAEKAAAAKLAAAAAAAAKAEAPKPEAAKVPAAPVVPTVDPDPSSATKIGVGVGKEVDALANLAQFRLAKARLVIASEAIRELVPLQDQELVIGRSTRPEKRVGCRLNHDAVSSVHAAIRFERGRFFIRDLESKNGTYLGNEMLAPNSAREIGSDQHVRIGTIDALFVTEVDVGGGAIPAKRYSDAFEVLVADGVVPLLIAKRALAEAKEKGCHPGELLLLEGRLTVQQWCDAVARGPYLNVARKASAGAGKNRMTTILIVVIVLAAAAAAIWELKPEWLGLK